MEDEELKAQLNQRFVPPPFPPLEPEVIEELRSILRTNGIDIDELHLQHERYSLKMGLPPGIMTLEHAHALRTEMRQELEVKLKADAKPQARPRDVAATPKHSAGGADLSGLLGSSAPNSSGRKHINGSAYQPKSAKSIQTPSVLRIKREPASSPLAKSNGISAPRPTAASDAPSTSVPFSERQNPGRIEETLNEHIALPPELEMPFLESRAKVTANVDVKKFSYRPMAMHLSEASEVLDDRIDEFAIVIQEHHKLDDDYFGDAAAKKPEEIIAVGRICSDSPEPGLDAASIVLEGSRRMGAGRRIPLDLKGLKGFEFFSGQIVAVRGVNASGDYFAVREVLEIPLLPNPRSKPDEVLQVRQRMSGGASDPDDMETDDAEPRPLSIMVGAGPYTGEDNLRFEPLQALCEEAQTSGADALLLHGPFLDTEHPLLANGDISDDILESLDPDADTVTSLFSALISPHLRNLAQNSPGISLLLVPSVRDLVSAHVAFPQEGLGAGANRKLARDALGLPRQVFCPPNPATLSLNDLTFGVSSAEILHPLKRNECVRNPSEKDALARLPRYLIQQRHFYPLFPPPDRMRLQGLPQQKGSDEERLSTGACIDPAYLKLCDWQRVIPDVLILPSSMNTFAKVVEGVVVINPGFLAKRGRGFGTYARITAKALSIEEFVTNDTKVPHKAWERCRVDIVRI